MLKAPFRFADYLASSLDLDFFREVKLEPRHRPDEVAIFGHVHCLPSLTGLIAALGNVGIAARQVYLLPKPYSTIPKAVEALRALGVTVVPGEVEFRPGLYDEAAKKLLETGILMVHRLLAQRPRLRRLVIVDDGGLLTAAWWRLTAGQMSKLEVISVQQTASGLSSRRLGRSPYRKVDVARSAAKRLFEAKIIVEGLLAKVSSGTDVQLRTPREVAVVGVGALGSRLALMLRDAGKAVWVYDRAGVSPVDGITIAKSWRECVRYAQVVYGCTGTNWLDAAHMVSPIAASVTFVSCSSRDVEFKGLLQHCGTIHKEAGPRFAGLSFTAPNGASCHVPNWGFPINFDRAIEWEAEHDIALTRALIYGGILQALAIEAGSEHEDVVPLLPQLQRALVETWLDWQAKFPEAFGVSRAAFDDLTWWSSNSLPGDRPSLPA